MDFKSMRKLLKDIIGVNNIIKSIQGTIFSAIFCEEKFRKVGKSMLCHIIWPI